MDIDDDNNPFADSSIRQATAQSFTNQQTLKDYNPFGNTTIQAPYIPPPQQPSVAAFIPPSPAPVHQTPFYASATPPMAAASQPTGTYGSDAKQTSTRVDLSSFEKQQAGLEQHEKHLADRERALQTAAPIGTRVKNFPPLPSFCPCGPCFYHDISVEIPAEFQIWVRYLYYLWITYSITLFLNFIAGLSYFVVSKDGAATFGLSLVYLVLFVPASYVCWYRPIYRAFRTDSSVYFMIFFAIGLILIITKILFAIGIVPGMCGFARLGIMSTSTVVGAMMIILGCLWSLISCAAIILIIKVHRLYRQTGASLEQAQREFQTAFANNATVRGAAREAATAGINEAMRTDGNQQRPIY